MATLLVGKLQFVGVSTDWKILTQKCTGPVFCDLSLVFNQHQLGNKGIIAAETGKLFIQYIQQKSYC